MIVGMPIPPHSGEYQLLALACDAMHFLTTKCIQIQILRVILLCFLAYGDTSFLITPDSHVAHE